MKNKTLFPISCWKMFPLNKLYLSSDISSFLDRYMEKWFTETRNMWHGHPNRCQVLSRIYACNLHQEPQQHVPFKIWISVSYSETFGQGGWDLWVFWNMHALFILLHCHIGLRSLSVHPAPPVGWKQLGQWTLNISSYSMPAQAKPVLVTGLHKARSRPREHCKEEHSPYGGI